MGCYLGCSEKILIFFKSAKTFLFFESQAKKVGWIFVFFLYFLGGGGAKTSNNIIAGNGRQRFTNELTIIVNIFSLRYWYLSLKNLSSAIFWNDIIACFLKVLLFCNPLMSKGSRGVYWEIYGLLNTWPNLPLKTCPNSHHSQGALKFATQISPLLNCIPLINI